MYGDGFVDQAAAAIEMYISHEPPFGPPDNRHAVHKDWLRKHPEFDYTMTPGAACGTFYFGVGGEMGDPEKKLMVKRDSAGHAAERTGNPGAAEILRLRKDLMTKGGISAITRLHMLVGEVLNPELLRKQQEVMDSFPDLVTKTVPDSPYTLTALLCNTLTTDHVDAKDWPRGYAMMSTLGEYDGKLTQEGDGGMNADG